MKKIIDLFAKGYCWLICGANLLQHPLLLAMRLYWGWSFFQTGKGKLGNIGGVTDFFSSLHIPFPKFNAYLAGGTECIGGLMLMAGLASRLISIPLTFVLIIAYVTAESDTLKVIFSDPDKFTGATSFLFLIAVLVVLAFGPGVFSLDWVIGKIYRKKTAAAG